MLPFTHATEQLLLSDALEALWNKTGIKSTVSGLQPMLGKEYGADAEVDLVLDGHSHRYFVECKSVIDRKALLDQIDLRLRQFNSSRVLVTEYMSKELATHCRSLGLQFFDSHGNAYLRAAGLYVFAVGEKNERRHQVSKAPKGLTNTAALRVVFALLSKPELITATFKEIADISGVAMGTAHKVLANLEQRGYLLAAKRRKKMLEPTRLMEEWVTNFPTTLRPKLVSRRFSAPDPYWWQTADIADIHASWGSEVAATRMIKHLKPSTQTLYVDPEHARMTIATLVKNFRIRPDLNGPIEVMERFWSPHIEADAGIAPPLLVYSDLLSLLDSRAKETANIIREKFLEPTFHPG